MCLLVVAGDPFLPLGFGSHLPRVPRPYLPREGAWISTRHTHTHAEGGVMLLILPPAPRGRGPPTHRGRDTDAPTHPHTQHCTTLMGIYGLVCSLCAMHGHYARPCTLRSGGLLHPTPIPLASFREGGVHAMTPRTHTPTHPHTRVLTRPTGTLPS